MSGNEQRKQWAEHIRDEARALEVQQHSAGASHTPLEGPLPYSADQLAAAVASAVAAERQRCAEVADSWSSEARLLEAFGDFTEWELRAASATARAVGSEIRGGAATGRPRGPK
ncbi:hypothetical protein [Ramlibacter sp. AN1133]|uniref:hypothetical protein n=1 Tax=Ramlibacter sp. AN1133 TaxID=3133429 RepID=UPI0030BA9B91